MLSHILQVKFLFMHHKHKQILTPNPFKRNFDLKFMFNYNYYSIINEAKLEIVIYMQITKSVSN